MPADIRAAVLAGMDLEIRLLEKATPGPWLAWQPEPYELLVAAGGRRIADIGLDDAPVHDYNDQQLANARVIAKARTRWLDALRLLREDTEKHLESENTWGCLHCHELWPCQAIRERAHVYAPDALRKKPDAD